MEFVLALALCGFISVPVHACTIFVLTDTNRALFCNNEDWSNPRTRIWFVPAGTTNSAVCMSALMMVSPKED